jgi:DNA-binding NarL/FixJ family response regulator
VTDLRIVVVDDHPVVRAGLRGILEGSPGFSVVGEAADGLAALEVVAATQPDVLLLDLRMPVLDGASTIERLAATWPGVRVLVLTTYDQDQDILRAVEAGATGVLLKDAPREELFRPCGRWPAASRSWRRAHRPAAGPVAGARSRCTHRTRARGAPAGGERAHQPRHRTAAVHLRGNVKTHLVHAFDKLGVDDRTAAVTVALERGLLLLDR